MFVVERGKAMNSTELLLRVAALQLALYGWRGRSMMQTVESMAGMFGWVPDASMFYLEWIGVRDGTVRTLDEAIIALNIAADIAASDRLAA